MGAVAFSIGRLRFFSGRAGGDELGLWFENRFPLIWTCWTWEGDGSGLGDVDDPYRLGGEPHLVSPLNRFMIPLTSDVHTFASSAGRPETGPIKVWVLGGHS
jgi:hypothetical protein